MSFQKLEWDSAFFKKEIFEFDYNNSKILLNNIPEFCDLIVLKNCTSENLEIPNYQKNHQEIKVVFSKKLNQNESIQLNKIVDADQKAPKKEKLYDLAYESGKYSRFKLDKKFTLNNFKSMYKMWIDNTLNKSIADKLFYIEEGDTIIGLATVKKYKYLGKIGLIGIDKQYQGYGYGSLLIKAIENYLSENNIFTLLIPTQKENIPACKFYTKLGYTIKSQTSLKHYWNIHD